ncbi:AAA family ATPase [Nonomuraea rosea]|uniref:AAA family ATPase n=2 Tax=Nonomuraea rosea TaxID=638574 RepID=A0ABP6VS53_9ACTN
MPGMIVWLNGTFGAGKTTTSGELVRLLPGARIYDTEEVGFMLRRLRCLPPVKDFQDWKPWRGLVVETAVHLLDQLGGTLVVPQTVLVEQYWTEIRTGLEKAGIRLHHFVLDSDEDTLTHRIDTDSVEAGARQWRLDHLPRYRAALPWLSRAATVVTTSGVSPAHVAGTIAGTIA